MNPIEDKERYTLSKIVSDTLKDYIVKNNLTTGDKLPSERELVKMFDVSRVVIREALHALESTGIITIKYGEGAFVNTDDSSVVFNNLLQFWQMNDNNTEDLLELRHLLEKSAVEHLIEKTNIGQLDELESSIENMSKSKDLEEFTKYDIEFHLGLISATNNELFVQLGSIIVQYFSNLSSEELSKEEKEKAIQEHRLILMALKNKDKKEALQLLFDHFQGSKLVRSKRS
ncbi:FadR/GntR family transcriptional regulator [Bacillus sp. JJ1533]|uniref:FadR/GntR family transcriptional regulator n=1 Tax=Bacillus sp. JJ1533 TaxID=3122959 RepID=UPI0030006A76